MSDNLKAIALTDEMIAKLTKARDEMQKRHDETMAELKAMEEAKAAQASKQIANAFAAARNSVSAALSGLFRR